MHRGRRRCFVNGKDAILLERQLDATQDLFDGEYSLILTAFGRARGSLEHFVRPHQHVGWNRQADLLRGL
jgi:hypothetical protein